MNKTLFIAAVLFVPSLAYSANPSADLSVQVVPPSSSGIACDIGPKYTGAIPPAAQAAGFTRCAANYDFTNTSAYSNANMSTWLSCPDSGNPGYQLYCVRPGSSVFPPASDMVLVNDGGVQALQLTYTPADATNGVGGTQLLTYSGQGNPNPPGTFFALGAYSEYVGRTPASSAVGNLPVIMGAIFWNDPHTENWLEQDISEFYTYNSGGPPNGSINNAAGVGEHCVGSFNCSGYTAMATPFSNINLLTPYDPTVYHTYGMRTTVNTSGNLGICVYFDGSQLATDSRGNHACVSGNLQSGASDSALTARYGMDFYDVPQGGAINKSLVELFQRLTIWTCSGYQTGPCTTSVDLGVP
jgi:hypothetical protein